MRELKYLPAAVLAILLITCVISFYTTRESTSPAPRQNSSANTQEPVDTSLLESAVRLAALASTADEQALAREAWRLADHELDLHYAAEMIDAQAEASQRLSPALLDLSNQITQLQAQVEADKKQVNELANDTTGAVDRARAKLELEQDQLDARTQELTRKGGDKRAHLQRVIQQHEASDKIADQTMKFGNLPPTGTMSEQVRAWRSLAGYLSHLQTAREQVIERNKGLTAEREKIQHQQSGQSEASASVAGLHQMADQQKKLTGLDQRSEDTKELGEVYKGWTTLVALRRRGVLHLLQGSLAEILGIMLAAALLSLAISIFTRTNQRGLYQVRVIARIVVQIAAVLLILLIIFGPPTQVSTMIGLITAGLTVVMKDFIVAFFGWFTLMGKNGIRVGDWVEIEGVSGEVIEIGLLKTVLLELGNWTETGHPTGRRVAFSNSFAMERHYFNFSTSGQWLWDEVRITLPSDGDPYETAQLIREIVEQQTQTDAAAAAKDWERVTQHYTAHAFSAAPTVSLRPGINGLELVVRYITRAPERNTVKSKLFQSIVDLLRKPSMARSR
jgi:small-conductance mechanosensitive channel